MCSSWTPIESSPSYSLPGATSFPHRCLDLSDCHEVSKQEMSSSSDCHVEGVKLYIKGLLSGQRSHRPFIACSNHEYADVILQMPDSRLLLLCAGHGTAFSRLNTQGTVRINFPPYSSAEINEEITQRTREWAHAITPDAVAYLASSVCLAPTIPEAMRTHSLFTTAAAARCSRCSLWSTANKRN